MNVDVEIDFGHAFLRRLVGAAFMPVPVGQPQTSPLRQRRLIKSAFSRNLATGERISQSRAAKGERGIWQRRYWEHTIRDDDDFVHHVDYIHINPVKHGLVTRVRDWPYSSFHRMVKLGVYPGDWAGDVVNDGGAFGEPF